MKKIILMITLFIMTISTTLMAKSGAGVDITVPLGAGIGYFFQDGERIETLKPNAGFEGGVYLRPNYYFDLAVLSLGFSLDLGYQRDVFGYKSDRNIEYLSFDSLSIGLMPKIDVLFLSVGVGAGVKFLLLYNFTLGIYVSYDFMAMQYKNVEPKVTFGALDIGGQVGIRF